MKQAFPRFGGKSGVKSAGKVAGQNSRAKLAKIAGQNSRD
jgi:hypothetical protein